MPPVLSVVVPVFNEEANLAELHRRLAATLPGVVAEFEILFVDDGSRDRSWELIRSLAAADPHVRGVRFSRNFGHQMAFAAGLDHARGEAVVIMDADLQDPPS
jgi:dolichol-phosphate mannosyltransferase